MVQGIYTELYGHWDWSVGYTVCTEVAAIQDAVEIAVKIWPYDWSAQGFDKHVGNEYGVRKQQFHVSVKHAVARCPEF